MPENEITKRIKHLKQKKDRHEAKIRSLETKISISKRKLDLVSKWLEEYKLCTSCNGWGKLGSTDQDDGLTIVQCHTCQGKGYIN
jgi:DnaJ-class molecular chaperone